MEPEKPTQLPQPPVSGQLQYDFETMAKELNLEMDSSIANEINEMLEQREAASHSSGGGGRGTGEKGGGGEDIEDEYREYEQDARDEAPQMGPLAEETLLEKFHETIHDMLGMVLEMFDDCPKTKVMCSRYENLVLPFKATQIMFIKAWHKQMRPYIDACVNKNFEPFLEKGKVPILDELDFANKYRELTDEDILTPEEIRENIDNFSEYIVGANRIATLYIAVPSGMLGNIQKIARGMSMKANREGGLGFSFSEMIHLGVGILKKTDPDDTKNLVEILPEVFRAIDLGGLNSEFQKSNIKLPNMTGLTQRLSNVMTDNGPDPASLSLNQGWRDEPT